MTAPEPRNALGRRVAVMMHTGLGDTLMVVPLVKAIRALAPEVDVRCTAHALAREVLELTGTGAGILPWPAAPERGLPAAVRGVLALRAFGPDCVIVPPGLNLRKASWAVRASGARFALAAQADHDEPSQVLRGFESGAFTEVVPRTPGVHKCELVLGLLPRLGLPEAPWAPPVRVDPAREAASQERLRRETGLPLPAGRVLGLHLGCTPGLQSKLYPPARLLAIAQQFCERRDATGLVFWGPGEEPAVREALASLPAPARVVAVPWRATLAETSAMLGLCRVVVASDSGIMHLAAARGQKVLGLFGPTNPAYCGPYGRGNVVLWSRTPCAPCYARPEFYHCPYGVRCMAHLPADAIREALDRLWDGEPGSEPGFGPPEVLTLHTP